jgi:hypothetical protein
VNIKFNAGLASVEPENQIGYNWNSLFNGYKQVSMTDWEKTLERKLSRKFLSPNAVRDGFIESYCILLKAFQQKKGNYLSDSEINDRTFSMVRDLYREKDIHYEIPPKPVIMEVNRWIQERLNIGDIKGVVPEAFQRHERTCQELLDRMDTD